MQSPIEAKRAIAAFRAEGTRLLRESKAHTSYASFADQLARTVSRFHFAQECFKEGLRRVTVFERAFQRWELARKIWQKLTEGKEYFALGDPVWKRALQDFDNFHWAVYRTAPPGLLVDACAAAGGRRRRPRASVSIAKLSEIGLASAEEVFRAALSWNREAV
jgi:hypothetical protein